MKGLAPEESFRDGVALGSIKEGVLLGGSREGFILGGTKVSDVYDVCWKLEVGITGDDRIIGMLGEINLFEVADDCIDGESTGWTVVAEM